MGEYHSLFSFLYLKKPYMAIIETLNLAAFDCF